jgi:glutamine synthetase
MVLYSVFKSGIDGTIADIPNLRSAKRFLPDNIYDAMENFHKSIWTAEIFSEAVRERYLDLKKASADRCPRLLGTVVKASEIQFHHEVYNQFLWNQF